MNNKQNKFVKIFGVILIALILAASLPSYADDPTTTTTPTTVATTLPVETTLPHDIDSPLPTDTAPTNTTPSKEEQLAKQKAAAANKNLDKASQKLLDTQLKIDQTTIAIQETIAKLSTLQDQIESNSAILAVNELPTAQLKKEIQFRAIKLYKESSGVPTDALAQFNRDRVLSLADSVQDSSLDIFSVFQPKVNDLSNVEKDLESQQAQAQQLQVDLEAQNAQLAKDFEGAKKEYEKQSKTFLAANGSIAGRLAVDGKMCPIAGPMTHVDDWGDPRSGGRRHLGNDLFNAQGTPNVAIVAGRIERTTGGLGGNGVFLYGDDGNAYYYAHLLTWAGELPRRVNQGEVIGYTGATGNAAGGAPHTHFEIRIGNTMHTNPYAIIRIICGV